jgi:creatinine amidohydrolase/Fe(II)-dependent formamide hydrolase-like protein
VEEIRFDRMTSLQVVARRTACSLAYLPVGSLEWHGPHMPFGTDYMTVGYLAEEAARRFGGVAFPPMYYGDMRYILQENRPEWRKTYTREMGVPEGYVSTFGLEYAQRRNELSPPPDDGPAPEEPLGLGVGECETFFSHLIARALLAIHLYGFRRIIVMPGHGPNPAYCRRAETIFRDNVLRRRALGDPARTLTWFYIEAAKECEPMLRNHWIHADRWEGSVTMVAQPGAVHPESLPQDRATLVPAYLGEPYLDEDRGYHADQEKLWPSFDYFDPRNGMNEAYGREQTEGVLRIFGELVGEFLADGAEPG